MTAGGWKPNSEGAAAEARKLLGVDLSINDEGTDLVFTDDGDLAVSEGRDCLRENLDYFFYSDRGERPRHPDWGLGIYEYIGKEPLTESRKAALVEYVGSHLLQDTRVKEIINIEVREGEDGTHKAVLEVSIIPIDEAGPMSLVFPFDLEVG